MSHKDASPETESQTACREWWERMQPHVKRAWGRAKDGRFFAEESHLLHQAWLAALASQPQAHVAAVPEGAHKEMADEYQKWLEFFHRGEGDYDDFLRVHGGVEWLRS
ncbi:hypothetical protein AB8810_13040 [Xanthomonas sp. NCPPB 3005]|uniref:hypothetical protein n=1 Tax=Xanthomonas sp. NCPPB 3005 TaxID=3240913 RepID=UPI003515ACD0